MRLKRRKPQNSPAQQGQTAVMVSEKFAWEQRDAKGNLLATNKKLKAKERIKMWIRRRRRHARI